MKKIVVFAALVSIFAICHAQFSEYGVKVGLGAATMNDDLSTKSPVLAVNVGGYINYSFLQNESLLSEILYLQTGLNLVRRGSNFEEVLERGTSMSIRTGYYHPWYIQLPIVAGLRYELPIRAPGHVVGFFLGPAVSFGLFGGYGDRKISPGVSSPSANYDVNFNGSLADRQVFNHINRIDIGTLVGFTYTRQRLTVSFIIDHGFLATSDGVDALRIIQNQASQSDIDVKIPNGNNVAYLLTLSYQLGDLSK